MRINNEDILQTGNLELLARKAVEGFITGFHKSPFHGFSVEFAEHRSYNSGDNLRNVDWKLYGRTDKLYTKRFEEETNLRCQIVIDTSSSMQINTGADLSKLQFATWSAAVLVQMLKKQRDAAGLCFFDTEISKQTRMRSSGRHYKELLMQLSPYLTYTSNLKETEIHSVLHQIAERTHRRSMIILFTDFFEAGRDLDRVFDSFQHLKHNKHEIIVFQTVDRSKEIDFDFAGVPTTFIDAETGAQLKLKPQEIKEEYQSRINAYEKEIKLKMSQYKVDYMEADVAKGVEHVLIPFLVKRNRMT